MNREQKRAMQRAGALAADGTPTRQPRESVNRARPQQERTSPKQFVSEVRAELRKVNWPTRAETIRLSIIVLVAIVILGAFIFVIDIGFGELTDFLFPSPTAGSLLASLPALLT